MRVNAKSFQRQQRKIKNTYIVCKKLFALFIYIHCM